MVISIILPGGKQLISPLTEKYVLKKQQIIGLIIGINLTHTLQRLSNRLKQTKEHVSRTLLQKKKWSFKIKYEPVFLFLFYLFPHFYIMLSTKDEAEPPQVRSVPKIDLTLFTTADGTVVSTKERIIKGTAKRGVTCFIWDTYR